MGLTPRRRSAARALTAVVLALAAALGTTVLATAPRAAAATITNLTPPEITGDPVFAGRLRAGEGTWDPDGLTFAYQWLRDGAEISGATGRVYRPGLDDLAARLSVTVTASDGVDSLSVTSGETGPVRRADFVLGAPPAIDGSPRYAQRLTATAGGWTPRPERVRFQWLRGGDPIPGARRASYRLTSDDVGHRIRVQVSVRAAGYHRATAGSAPTATIRHRVPLRRTVTYRVETRGRITADLSQFRAQVQQTYDDPRGWRGAGIGFRPVTGRSTFTVVLAEASWVPRFSSACSAEWSCRVGRYVIINQTRWLHASPAWNAAGRSRRDYRHMVVNHETGHWLGHGHASCPAPGRLAPVMQQQSKGTQGCGLNPWPLARELWAHPSGTAPRGFEAAGIWVE